MSKQRLKVMKPTTEIQSFKHVCYDKLKLKAVKMLKNALIDCNLILLT